MVRPTLAKDSRPGEGRERQGWKQLCRAHNALGRLLNSETSPRDLWPDGLPKNYIVPRMEAVSTSGVERVLLVPLVFVYAGGRWVRSPSRVFSKLSWKRSKV